MQFKQLGSVVCLQHNKRESMTRHITTNTLIQCQTFRLQTQPFPLSGLTLFKNTKNYNDSSWSAVILNKTTRDYYYNLITSLNENQVLSKWTREGHENIILSCNNIESIYFLLVLLFHALTVSNEKVLLWVQKMKKHQIMYSSDRTQVAVESVFEEYRPKWVIRCAACVVRWYAFGTNRSSINIQRMLYNEAYSLKWISFAHYYNSSNYSYSIAVDCMVIVSIVSIGKWRHSQIAAHI